MDDETKEEALRAALSSCVKRMKAEGLSGKLRDDAAGHFLAGAYAALGLEPPPEPMKYVDVLEALADAG